MYRKSSHENVEHRESYFCLDEHFKQRFHILNGWFGVIIIIYHVWYYTSYSRLSIGFDETCSSSTYDRPYTNYTSHSTPTF